MDMTSAGVIEDGSERFIYKAYAGTVLRRCCQRFYSRVLWQMSDDTARSYEQAGSKDKKHVHGRLLSPRQDPCGFTAQARDFWTWFETNHTADTGGVSRLPFHTKKHQVNCLRVLQPTLLQNLQLYEQYFKRWFHSGGRAPHCRMAPQREVLKVLREEFSHVLIVDAAALRRLRVQIRIPSNREQKQCQECVGYHDKFCAATGAEKTRIISTRTCHLDLAQRERVHQNMMEARAKANPARQGSYSVRGSLTGGSYTFLKQDGAQSVHLPRLPSDCVSANLQAGATHLCSAQILPPLMDVKVISLLTNIIPMALILSLADKKDADVSLTVFFMALHAVKMSARACAKASVLWIAGDAGKGRGRRRAILKTHSAQN